MFALKDKYFWRQCLILLSQIFHTLAIGLMLEFSFILDPYLLDKSSNIQATPSQIHQMVISNGIAAVIGFITLSPIMQIFGRKVAHIVSNATLIIGWGIIIFSRTYDALNAARVLQGYALGGLFINTILVSEYCHPKRRGYFIALKEAARISGILICHCLNSRFTYRQVAVFVAWPAVLSVIMTLFWPESPPFLAMKGRFEECTDSFRWLHGFSEESDKELESLISTQRSRLEAKNQAEIRSSFSKIKTKLSSKEFRRSLSVVSTLITILQLSGKYYIAPFVLKSFIDSGVLDSVFNIYIDLVLILALLVSCVLVYFFNRRVILFTGIILSMILMFCVGLCNEDRIILFVFLHVFVVYASIIPVCFTYFGELFALEERGVAFCASGIEYTVYYAVIMKYTPIFIKMPEGGIQNTYLTYGAVILIGLLRLYFVQLPETKGKTLDSITEGIKGNNVSNDAEESEPSVAVGKSSHQETEKIEVAKDL